MEDAGTLLDLLPPVGWGDVATKQDLDLLRNESRSDLRELKSDLKELRSDLRDELTSKLRGLFFAIAALFLTVVGLLIAAPHLI